MAAFQHPSAYTHGAILSLNELQDQLPMLAERGASVRSLGRCVFLTPMSSPLASLFEACARADFHLVSQLLSVTFVLKWRWMARRWRSTLLCWATRRGRRCGLARSTNSSVSVSPPPPLALLPAHSCEFAYFAVSTVSTPISIIAPSLCSGSTC